MQSIREQMTLEPIDFFEGWILPPPGIGYINESRASATKGSLGEGKGCNQQGAWLLPRLLGLHQCLHLTAVQLVQLATTQLH